MDELENQPTEDSATPSAPVEQPTDLNAAVAQLRVLVCGLGAGLLIVSVALTAFVCKQWHDLSAATANRQQQISQLQAREQALEYLVNELASYSAGKPELLAVFAKHGVTLTRTDANAPAQPSTPPEH